jgi:hypothetical protein
MTSKITVRYASGREDRFEFDPLGGPMTELRLKEFAKEPTLLLQTDSEIIVIPAHAIECLTISAPQLPREQQALPNVRKVKRLK